MRLLAVDDDPIILELLEHFAETIPDHSLVATASAAEALELMTNAAEPFDCFLLDIQMPETSGIDLCRILRGMKTYSRTPVLMLTAMSDKIYIDDAFNAGATDYITKPFELSSLRGRLSLVERIAAEQPDFSGKIFASNVVKPTSERDELNLRGIALQMPLPIADVDGVIEHHAMENYLSQLSSKSLFGSVVLGFAIREVAALHADNSAYDFGCVITDVSEAISDCLLPAQRMVSYAGNGVFLGVVEGATHIDLERLIDQINRYIGAMELCNSDGLPHEVKLSIGEQGCLVWRKGKAALEAMQEASESARKAARIPVLTSDPALPTARIA